ncbi:Protocadherin-like wing polarity protein stan [Amphibalanus amphitrite]|uniref:Protocadherin-like wing polarity protein stan n=1 Tax=Amphibalanus amphitrite TaxID=1232801 RepID=A0A6A4VK12_AMPAM|nr:Protocadherin-like wing polarity protein stan [Amphibalanus amphitrite]
MRGTVLLMCGADVARVPFTMEVVDANTAAPVFDSERYTTHVMETLPVGMVVGSLVISAADADPDVANHELSFGIQEDSPFSLTEPCEDQVMCCRQYTTQLKLEKPLDWATNATYQLTVTAQDPGGNQGQAVIEVYVIQVATVSHDGCFC